jgi:tetratricopeptide (TPR) repeat protein
VVAREELRQRLWPGDTFVDFETGLNTAVSKLRDALSDSAESPRYIETIPRRGYRFISPVEILPANGRTLSIPGPSVAPPAAAEVSAKEAGTREQVRVIEEQPKRSWIAFTVVGTLALLALGGLGVWFFEGRSALSFNSHDAVLIADFENQTGDPRFDSALGTAFVVSIEQSRYTNVFPRTRLDSVLTRMGKPPGQRVTPSLGREICQRENIRGLLACSITRTGQEYVLTAQLIDPHTGDTVRSYTEHAHDEDHILEALDALSKKVREALGESLYQIHQASKPLPQVTTNSLTALQQYAEGWSLWHHGKYVEAITLYKAAVASDPDFAMAHAALGSAYYSYITNAPEQGRKEYEKALSLTSRTTDRERMLIETHYAADRNHLAEAATLFIAYLNRYPEDAVSRFDYANLLRNNGRYAEAIEQYNQVLRTAPDFAHAYIGIAVASKTTGNYPAALQAYAKAFEIEPQWLTTGNNNREYGFTLVANGEDQKAEQVFSAMLSNPRTRESGLRSLAFLDLYHGRYANAQHKLEQSLDILKGQNSPLSEARVQLLLAIVAEGKSDPKAQQRHLEAAISEFNTIESKVVFGAMLGDACARGGLTKQAEKIAATITPLMDPNNLEHREAVHLLQGDLALSAGKADEAIGLLQQADSENSTGLTKEAIAHAYETLGDTDKAIAAYESMFGVVDRSLGWEPQQRWLEGRYLLARNYLEKGQPDKAKQALAVLLNLWKDADANLPLVKKMNELQASLSQ